MLKKTTLAVLGLAASGLSNAGAMGPICTPVNVTVPCIEKHWDFGIQALYLKSVFDADKAYAQTVQTTFSEAKNDWDWGYRFEGSYHFNTGNDVSVNWTHYQGDVHIAGANGFTPVVGLVDIPYLINNQDRFDQVNMVLGQHVDYSSTQKLRYYGGFQYANIQANASNFYTMPAVITAATGLTSIFQYDNTDFKGVGPVVGIDYAIELTNEFSLTANGSGSILYGTSRYNMDNVILPFNINVLTAYASKKAIVPSLEGKLGLNYVYSMTQGLLNLELGYQVVNYFNALQTQNNQNIAAGITNSDYGLFGPYLGIKYVGLA